MIKIRTLIFILTIPCLYAFSQENYWQQKVDYKIDIDFAHQKNQFTAHQKLIYTNNSPDTIKRVFFHLYYNAFQPGSMMDVRSRTIKDPDSRVGDRISLLSKKEIGYHKVIKFSQDNIDLDFFEDGTILDVQLKTPILPGQSTIFSMEYESQVPLQIRRTGRDNFEGIDYSMTQWYIKICEYDKDGWHSNPYIGREFHGVWGNFDVSITIDKAYILCGTGILQNSKNPFTWYKDKKERYKQLENNKITWNFKANNVHDFTWAADPDYIHDTAIISNGTILNFFHQDDSLNDNWNKLKAYTVKTFEYMNKNFGEYPYKQYSVIQGGDGGMEYPMCTLITSSGSFGGLVSVTVHESIHSWFQGLLATNESKYEWMDEGFCTFAQYRALNYVYNKKPLNPLARNYGSYYRLIESGLQEPLTTHADFYNLNYAYGVNAYNKGAILINQLGYIIGEDKLMEGMREYFDLWKFKHPNPQDFKRVMERTSGIELDWYFEQFVGTTNTIDYSIKSVEKNDGKTNIVLERKDKMPMPIDLIVKLKDGSVSLYYIPLRIMRGEKGKDVYPMQKIILNDWPWVYPEYNFEIDINFEDIQSIQIDPSTRMADINQEDNIFEK
jgi:hypothetical protein